MSEAKPLHEVFLKRAQGVGHILRGRVWRMDGFAGNERLNVDLIQNDDGTSTLAYTRHSDGDARIEIGNIKPDGLANVVFGEEHIAKSQQLGSNEEVVDNRNGVAEIEVSFRDLFSKTESKEKEKSAGTSIKIAVESEQDIEGVASFKESVETEAHAELSESEGTETTSEVEGEEGTTVPVGKRVRITETRERADGFIEVTAHGKFVHRLDVGKHSGGGWHGGHNGHWDSWNDFCDVVKGEAPDNWSLAKSFKDKHAYHADLWALNPLEATVKYKVSFEGRVVRSYSVEEF